MIQEIIEREWEFFGMVQNIGGRAECQNNYDTFYLHRKAQYDHFDEPTLTSYLHDLTIYKEAGINPITLKYAYMMESSDPTYYAQIKTQLPQLDDETKAIIEEVIAIELEMLTNCNAQYPKFAKLSRGANSHEDDLLNTSFETYLRGELYTYSPTTLMNYAKMIIYNVQNDINFVFEIRQSSAIALGYVSLADAESKIK